MFEWMFTYWEDILWNAFFQSMNKQKEKDDTRTISN